MPNDSSKQRNWLTFAAAAGGLAVALGAFGAHGLRGHVSAERYAAFHTGVEYQLVHALAMLALSLNDPKGARFAITQVLFAAGIVLFSGSLYLLVVLDQTAFGWLTPLGGTSFVVGWILLFVAARKRT